MSKHAAFTIISKNYYSLAKTLAESYKKHHPENDFLIVLVDRADGHIPERLSCGAEVVELRSLRIPGLASFTYRYTIMELNTAVKPFAFADLLERRGYSTLLYLDPDIWILRSLAEIYKALENASVVLIPHTRRPYYDGHHPSDLSILQSGTYNLGFLGLKRASSTERLLEWWMTKLYRDCVVDIPNGLFVDQKWMDLVPGFIPDHAIIHHPGYNVAYWNLHERRLMFQDGAWTVDNEPLVFFHFSGYTPVAPHQLSKHQNRYSLHSFPELKALTDQYGEALLGNGYEECSAWPYAFETLSNGVRLPLGIVRDVMQWASRNGISTPDPFGEPDAFCRFLMSRGSVADAPKAVVLFHFLLKRRTDVLAAYPGSVQDSDNEGFRKWIQNSGVDEEQLRDLLPFEGGEGRISDYVADAFNGLRQAKRTDVLESFKNAWKDPAEFERLAEWFTKYGVEEMGFEAEHTRRIRAALPGIARILHIYFLRGDLQITFPVLWEAHQRHALIDWLRQHARELRLTAEEISLFAEFAGGNRALIEKMRFLYQHFGQTNRQTPSIYSVDKVRYLNQIVLDTKAVTQWLSEEEAIEPADHYKARFGNDLARMEDFEKCIVPGLPAKQNYALVKRLRAAFSDKPEHPIVNFAGFLDAPSGMGESARSMRMTLEHANASYRPVSLPHPRAYGLGLPTSPVLFGWPNGRASASITVANADSKALMETVLPGVYWAPKNVGYWVWETEELPRRFKETEQLFNEIWTPSEYSASAIRRTVGCNVRVLPHTLDFAALEQAAAGRERFGLPASATLFGFIFDPESVLERKNVRGLIDAFRAAFREDDDCYLILKMNDRAEGVYDLEMVRARADWDRIIFLEKTFSRQETYDFMKSLDVYVSLHRSEGFGLTCAEAMALGLPVLASEYSGNLDFMNGGNSVLVPTKVIETERPYGPYPAGTRWGDPDAQAAIESLRSLKDAERRAAIGAVASQEIRSSLSPDRIGALAEQMIRALMPKQSAATVHSISSDVVTAAVARSRS
jgi:glycosyltransferase involved in cell wall biosynthesis